MKKFMAIMAAAVLTASLAACGGSADTASSESDLEAIKANGSMKIGYTIINPLNYTDDEGNFVGFETEFSTAVCEKLGVTPEFIEINWDSKEVELNSKNIDVIWNGMTVTPERAEAMSLTIPYLENKQVLVVKSENAEKYTASLEGATVIAEAGSAGEEVAQSDEFFASATYTPVASQATALMDVAAGTSDVAVIDYVMAGGSVGEGTSYEDLVIVDKDFAPEEYAAACRKGSDTTEAINAAIEELAADGTLADIAAKYGLEDILLVK